MFKQVKLSLHNTFLFLKHTMLYLIKHNSKSAKQTFNQASTNILFFIEFFITLPQNRPFILYNYQEKFILDLIKKINHKKNLLVEKSSEMGATTSVVATFLWLWLFGRNNNLLIFSPIKSKLYMKKDNSGAFNLLLYMLEKLPEFLKPQNGYKLSINKDKMYYICLENNDNNNKIYGISAGQKRDLLNNLHLPDKYFKAALLDDFAFHKNADHHWAQIDRLCNSRIVISTPNGSSNLFAELIKLEYAEIFTLHWMLHPDKTTTWYQQVCQTLDPVEIEQTINISYDYRVSKKRKKVAASNTTNNDTVTTKPKRKYSKKTPSISVITGKKRTPHKNLPLKNISKEPSLQTENPESQPIAMLTNLISSKWQKISLKPDNKSPQTLHTSLIALSIIKIHPQISVKSFRPIIINNETYYEVSISGNWNYNQT